jgi:ATP-dependent helicase HrpB
MLAVDHAVPHIGQMLLLVRYLPKVSTMNSYPIDDILPKMREAVSSNSCVVLQAPPGAGKTTRVPIALLDVLPPEQGRIVMLEPRRIAAVNAARWMAKSLHEQPGETVGYAIRFDTKISQRTRLEVVTEGVLTRRIQTDPGLDEVAMVIFDEFHERSIHADLALALCLDIQKTIRADLKIIVMSATLDSGPIAALLGNAPVLVSTGKAFPVDERYIDDRRDQLSIAMRVNAAVRTALKETHGDILVFLPGSGEIRASVKALHESLNASEDRISIHSLYGDLPFEEQERAIVPSMEKRKIVLATNIAETSLTIEGVHVVIDSGLTRMIRHDPSSGMNRLVTVPVSRASAEQRKGRAGRLGPGVCYRLYTRRELQEMLSYHQPEIAVSDLSQLCLELAAWGVRDPASLDWLDRPLDAAWNAAQQLLRELGAIDRSGSVTPLGRAMVRLPIHPRLSRLMIKAQELGCLRLGADIAAILTERDIVRHSAGGRIIREPDISERLETLRTWKKGITPGTNADPSALRTVERTATQLMRLMSGSPDDAGQNALDPEKIARLLLSAYSDRICKRREEERGRFVHVQGRGVRLSSDSHLNSSRYIVAMNVDAGESSEGFVHMAAEVTEEQIRSECNDRIETIRNVAWDSKEERIAAGVEDRIGALLLSSRLINPADEETAPILVEVIRAMPGLLRFSKEARQLQGRVGMMKRVFPDEKWPDLSDDHLRDTPDQWLLPWLSGIRSAQGIRALNLLPALKERLTREQQRHLEERAPLSITVPSGSRVNLDYSSGDHPVLAVKVQEMFGLADTPMIAAGRIKVLIHLLSPAHRPVQITQDLKGFWNSGYPQVKKDLKGRYPKHPWPDDPWNAVPTRRTKRSGVEK